MLYQPRYVAYAKAHKMTPDQMKERDREKYPEGSMCGYIAWIREKTRAFREINPDAFLGEYVRDHKAFTEYLFTF